MSRKKKSKGAPHFAPARRYYDPGAHAKPRRPVGHGLTFEQTMSSLPIGMSRAERRRRSKMTFAEQRQLAATCQFRVPDARDTLTGEEQGAFIKLWEAGYAARSE